MKKRLISCLLAISILSSYIPVVPFTTVSKAAATTVWEFEYTAKEQTFQVPYKGIYKIEAYGAQGGTASKDVSGGKGNYIVGTVQFDKDTNLAIYVGGQDGYNGGGAGNTVQGVGGGATDIRYKGNKINDRILVAAGGGGSYANAVYHKHTATTGSCYKACGYEVGYNHTTQDNDGDGIEGDYYRAYCKAGLGHGYVRRKSNTIKPS